MPLPDQRFHLSPEKPQPGVPVHRALPVLERASPDRPDALVLRQIELLPRRLVAECGALALHSESKSSIGPLAFPLTFVCRATAKTPAIHFGVRPALGDVGKAGKIYGLRPV